MMEEFQAAAALSQATGADAMMGQSKLYIQGKTEAVAEGSGGRIQAF